MLTPPLISCVIPVFNGERFLQEALDSVRAQTYRPLEIIVANDGSTDGTAEIVARNRADVVETWQPTSGPAATRNRGISLSNGDFVAFLDADDLWHPEKLTRQMARFDARSELGVSVTHVQPFWMPELREEEQRLQGHPRSQPIAGFTSGAMLVRRAVFETVGVFDPTLWHADDTDWFLRARALGTVIELLPDILLHRRIHEMNISRRFGADSQEEYLRLVKAALDRQRGRGTNMADPHPT